MENASNIFYYENSVANDSIEYKHRKPLEDLFAHETAHQYFGDEASEIDWPHLWLSEGFATYMTQLYLEHEYGTDSLKKRMQHDRALIINFYKKRKTPVVDTSSPGHLEQLLNANSYEKGSWVLHMLRRKLGEKIFQKGIRAYYNAYKGKNASTNNFMEVMEQVSKQNLALFFKQWLYTAGQPVISGRWRYDQKRNIIILSINQTQNFIFQFPLQLAIKGSNRTIFKTIEIKSRKTEFSMPVNFKPETIGLDPGVNLLFEGKMEEDK
jgi:aminopeptidase N